MKKIKFKVLTIFLLSLVFLCKTSYSLSPVTEYESNNIKSKPFYTNFVVTPDKKIKYLTTNLDLVTFDPSNGQFTSQKIKELTYPNNDGYDSLGISTFDSQDNLWFTSQEIVDPNDQSLNNNFINRINPAGQLIEYPYSELDVNGCPAVIFGLESMPSGELWGFGGALNICDSAPGGVIVKIDPANGQIIQEYPTDLGYVSSLTQTSNNEIVYTGASYNNDGKTVGKLNTQTGSFSSYTTNDDFGSKVVIDKDKNIWLSTLNSSESKNYLVKLNDNGMFDKFSSPMTYFSPLVTDQKGNIWLSSIDIALISGQSIDNIPGFAKINSDGSYEFMTGSLGAKVVTHISSMVDSNNLWALTTDFKDGDYSTSLFKIPVPEDGKNNTLSPNPSSPKAGNYQWIAIFIFILLALILIIMISHRRRKLINSNSEI